MRSKIYIHSDFARYKEVGEEDELRQFSTLAICLEMKFNYNQNNYDLTLSCSVHENFCKTMEDVASQVKTMGSRGSNLDYV